MEASTHYLFHYVVFFGTANSIKKYVALCLYCAKSVSLLFVSDDYNPYLTLLLYITEFIIAQRLY